MELYNVVANLINNKITYIPTYVRTRTLITHVKLALYEKILQS